MGKSVPSPTRLKEFARVATKKLSDSLELKKMENPQIPNRRLLSEVVSDHTRRRYQEAGGETPTFQNQNRLYKPETSTSSGGGGGCSIGGDSEKLKLNMENLQTLNRMPLSEVVSDCVMRWFQETLKDAKDGDLAMQVLVGQMYFSGYGVSSDAQKGRAWIQRAARRRSAVWKVSDKRPGYGASDSDSDLDSDSDSDELKDDVK